MRKIALVTGGSKGIGRAIVKSLLNEKYIVIDASRSRVDLNNQDFYFIKTDVAIERDIDNLFSFINEKFGRLDVLINNAGFGKFAPFNESKLSDFDDMFAVNVRGLYMCTKKALNFMLEQKSGFIANIASIAGKTSIEQASIYCATKHAVMGLTKSLFLEVRKSGIRVVAICPGSVDTNFFDQPGTTLHSDRNTLLAPQDVADAVIYALKSPERCLVNEIELRPLNPVKKS
ncbi:MAG TPA: SDR family oxidoreductase [Ignavibacteria bacterium]|nr:SDR family oxidoreductase [Ignavibacteria bacterium]